MTDAQLLAKVVSSFIERGRSLEEAQQHVPAIFGAIKSLGDLSDEEQRKYADLSIGLFCR